MKSTKFAIFQFVMQVAIVVFLLVGFGLAAYPFVADHLSDLWHRQIQSEFRARMELSNQDYKDQQKANAKHMEERLADPYSMESLIDMRTNDYPNKWYVDKAIGELYIPIIKEQLTLFDEANEPVLQRGVGWVRGSDYPSPDNGPGTRTVVAGHSGLPHARLFNNLPDVKKGDLFIFYVFNTYFAYEVDDITRVLPNQIDHIAPVEGRNLATLVTCVPITINSHRLLVTGFRVPFTPEMMDMIQGIRRSRDQERWLWIAGTLAALALAYWLIRNAWRALLLSRMRGNLHFKNGLIKGHLFHEETTFALLNARGKKNLKRNGEYYIVPFDEEFNVEFTKLPARVYQVHEMVVDDKGHHWRLFFKPKLKKEKYEIVKNNKKKKKRRQIVTFKLKKKRFVKIIEK
ncbi:MAG: class C sortase [Streptococcaceae bacterium]|jgi:sortase A|nr:class C sortase [Streptococcaceae bacterium]